MIDLEQYFDTTNCDVYTFTGVDFNIIDEQLEPGDYYNTQVIGGLTYVVIDKSVSLEAPELTKI